MTASAQENREWKKTEKAVKKMAAVLVNLQGTLARMEDYVSSFPATKEFLKARGLSNVRELDIRGRRELVDHLERTFNLLTIRPESERSS